MYSHKYQDTTVPTGEGLPDTKITYSVLKDETGDMKERVFTSEARTVVVQQPVVVQRSEPVYHVERVATVVPATEASPRRTFQGDVRSLQLCEQPKYESTSVVVEHIPLDPKVYPRHLPDNQWYASNGLNESRSYSKIVERPAAASRTVNHVQRYPADWNTGYNASRSYSQTVEVTNAPRTYTYSSSTRDGEWAPL